MLLHFVSSLSPKVVGLYIFVSIPDIVTQGMGADNRSALEGGVLHQWRRVQSIKIWSELVVLLLIFCLDGCLAMTSSTASSTVDRRCARNENATLIGLISTNVVKIFRVGGL